MNTDFSHLKTKRKAATKLPPPTTAPGHDKGTSSVIMLAFGSHPPQALPEISIYISSIIYYDMDLWKYVSYDRYPPSYHPHASRTPRNADPGDIIETDEALLPLCRISPSSNICDQSWENMCPCSDSTIVELEEREPCVQEIGSSGPG